jgi:hypothetical protein
MHSQDLVVKNKYAHSAIMQWPAFDTLVGFEPAISRIGVPIAPRNRARERKKVFTKLNAIDRHNPANLARPKLGR